MEIIILIALRRYRFLYIGVCYTWEYIHFSGSISYVSGYVFMAKTANYCATVGTDCTVILYQYWLYCFALFLYCFLTNFFSPHSLTTIAFPRNFYCIVLIDLKTTFFDDHYGRFREVLFTVFHSSVMIMDLDLEVAQFSTIFDNLSNARKLYCFFAIFWRFCRRLIICKSINTLLELSLKPFDKYANFELTEQTKRFLKTKLNFRTKNAT